jgi:hypothetical protein
MKTIIKKLKGFFSKKPNVWYEDTFYHTGYYRFSEFHGSSGGTFTFGGVPSDKLDEYFNGSIEISGTFKVGGVPCLPQKGMKDFIFFSATDLCGMRGVIPVEKCYHEKFNTNEK